MAAECLPAAQATQLPIFSVYPALHKHAWISTLPAGEEELPGQGEHEALPAASLYVPAPHDTHAPPLGPVYPALHKHAWIPTLPAGEEESLGQSVHEAAPSPEKEPAGQLTQTVARARVMW